MNTSTTQTNAPHSRLDALRLKLRALADLTDGLAKLNDGLQRDRLLIAECVKLMDLIDPVQAAR